MVAGRYEVQAVIGKRPLGWVYRAREREVGVEVALRSMGTDVLPDETTRQAFVHKVARARAFSHPNLVRVFGVYPTSEEVVVAVQWAPGQTLLERIKERPFTVEEARPIVAQVAAAFTHAHQHGVVLADAHSSTMVLIGAALKVNNVGIGPALPRKRFLEAVREEPGYTKLPPELRSGMTVDTRADVFALGMLVVEMLTGGIDRGALKGPEPLLAVLARALAIDPLLRHGSVEALAQELEAGLSGQAPRVRRPTPPVGVPAVREAAPFPKLDDVSDVGPRPDDVRPPSLETTRAMDPEELDLLKGDQVTRQVPHEELIKLRAASTDTQEYELQELIVEEAPPPSPADELHLEAPPASDELKTEEVMKLEPDAAKTTEHPRLPPPVVEDEIDTARVTRADVEHIEGHDEPKDPNLTPLPPPMPASSTLTPAPPATGALPPSMKPLSSLTPLADAKEAPTSVERPMAERHSEPKIEINVEPPSLSTPAAPLYDEDDEEAPTRTVDPHGPPQNPPPPTPPPPPLMPPSNTAPAVVKAKRRNPFDPMPPAEDARTTEHASPPPRKRKRSPFDPVTGEQEKAAPAVGARTVDGKHKKKPRPTMVVPPLGARGPSPVLLVALAAFIAAVGVALAVSHYLKEERLEQERLQKQRLADELNAQAEALRRAQAADAGAPPSGLPVVTHGEPLPTMLPRAGACPLGAHLVNGPGHPYCIDVYEYPGGNTIPRTSVSFAEAGRICAARGERLCSESEWERACRGKGGSSYPYGQAYEPARCNTQGSGGNVEPAGHRASCKSAVGAYDMSGNVAEWVASGAQKGGSAVQGGRESRCSAVMRGPPPSGSVFVGFRCCADPTPPKKQEAP